MVYTPNEIAYVPLSLGISRVTPKGVVNSKIHYMLWYNGVRYFLKVVFIYFFNMGAFTFYVDS